MRILAIFNLIITGYYNYFSSLAYMLLNKEQTCLFGLKRTETKM